MFPKAIATSLLLAAVAAPTAAFPFGKTCDDVRVVTQNFTGKPIKVIDMNYQVFDSKGRVVRTGNELVPDIVLDANGSYTL